MSKDMELALEQVRRAAQREASPALNTITTFMGLTPKQIAFLRNYWIVRNQGLFSLDVGNIPDDMSDNVSAIPCQCDVCRNIRRGA